MKDQWRKRQAQWRRYEAWEEKQPSAISSVEERLAEMGRLVDEWLKRNPPKKESPKEMKKKVSGIISMRRALSVLGKGA